MQQQAVRTLSDPDQVQAISRPFRVEVLSLLREPDSAASVARMIDQPRQKVNYHLKELERVNLVQRVGERRKGNFVEQLFQAVARRFVVAPRFSWDVPTLERTLAEQVSLARLSAAGERLQRDAEALIDRAAFEGEELPSATAEVALRFEDEQARAAFLTGLLGAIKTLAKEHGSPGGEPYRLMLAAYPDRDGGES